MNKVRLTILPGGSAREFNEGTLLLDACADMGLVLRTPCGGRGFCGKCALEAQGALDPPSDAEVGSLGDAQGMRLACQARMRGSVTVRQSALSSVRRGRIPVPDPTHELGIAVDIGTTSIQAALVDLSSGDTHTIASFLNPQRRWGHDVISRIAAAADPAARDALESILCVSILSSIDDGLAGTGIMLSRITRLVLAGNTTMTYFFSGLNTAPLGAHPYTAAVKDFPRIVLPAAGVHALPGHVSALPVASAYLGGDLVGGLALLDERSRRSGVFFIDLGTNGEMFLRTKGGDIFAASCAMGPALEGMNISHGMTADEGAITHITMSASGPLCEVMGGGKPLGISGTGLIDAVSLMLESGLVSASGAFTKGALTGPFTAVTHNGVKAARIAGDVHVTQKDIRSLQLAKGASLAGARILLKEAGSAPEEIDQVFIAGAFGENLSIDHFKRLAFIPSFPRARYHFSGNTSLAAAARACVDPSFMERARTLRDATRVVELSIHPEFNDEFVKCLDF